MFSRNIKCWLLTLLLLATISVSVNGQSPVQYQDPQEAWRVPFMSMGKGNGVFISPNGKVLVAISQNADVSALDALSGEQLWTYTPNLASGAILTSSSGITFNQDAKTPYLVFSVTDELDDQKSW
jgi:outer membrane protein assembly factor BamB